MNSSGPRGKRPPRREEGGAPKQGQRGRTGRGGPRPERDRDMPLAGQRPQGPGRGAAADREAPVARERPQRPGNRTRRPAPDGAPRRLTGERAPPASGGRPAPAPEATHKLQKILAAAGLGSRREIEAWISAGRVTVNGQVARLGARAREGDRIQVDGRPVRAAVMDLPRVLIYHKPAGQIVSRNDPEGRPSVFDELPPLRGAKWIAVGRLDFNTEGLLIFTTSGDLAHRLMHPGADLEREYSVRILGEITLGQLKQLHEGVELSDGPARFESVEDAGGRGANRWYRVTIKEGRNREVRRIFEALGFTVSRLIRVRFGPIGLPPMLRRGRHRELLPAEVGLLAPDINAAPRGGREVSRDGARRQGERRPPREAGHGSEGTRNPRRQRSRAR